MPLAIFCGCTVWFLSDLVGNPEDQFSHNEAHLKATGMILMANFLHSRTIGPLVIRYVQGLKQTVDQYRPKSEWA